MIAVLLVIVLLGIVACFAGVAIAMAIALFSPYNWGTRKPKPPRRLR